MNAPELSPTMAAELRCGLPGPWQDLRPVIFGGIAESYVLVGNAVRPSPPYRGEASAFCPARVVSEESGIRSRGVEAPKLGNLRQRRPYRGYTTRRSSRQYTQYLMPERRDLVVGKPSREPTAEELAPIENYRPKRAVPPQRYEAIRGYVVEVVTEVLRHSDRSIHTYISQLVQYVDWCDRVMGVELAHREVFDRELISYFAMNVLETSSKGSRSLFRSKLLWIGDILRPGEVKMRSLERSGKSFNARPYLPAEIGQLKVWASAQSTAYTRHACWAMLAFGFGAGLDTTELDGLRSDDVEETEDGVVVTIRGGRQPRQVVVTADWEDYAIVLAQAVEPGGFIFRSGRKGSYPNLIPHTVNQSKHQPEGLTIRMSWMRLTWCVRLLNAGCPMPVFLTAAGLSSMGTMERIVPFLDDVPAEEAIGMMRAADAKRKAQFRAENPEYCNQLRRSRNALRRQFASEVTKR